MKDIILLTKVLFKNSLGKNINAKSEKKSKFVMSILVFIALIYLVFIFSYFSYEIINTLLRVRQEQLFLSYSLFLICMFSLFRTLFTSINILYFSKDVEFLLPMPIKPIKIVFAKFNLMLITSYITEILLFGVPYIIYWKLLNLDVLFFLYSILVFLVIPIIPVLISSTIIVLIMKFTNFFKNKDIVQYISIVFSILIVLGLQILNNSTNGTTNFVLSTKIAEINGFSSVITKYFFTIKQAMNVLTLEDSRVVLNNLCFLYIESIFAYIIVVSLISKLYLNSAIKVSSSGIKAKKLRLSKIKKKSILKSYVEKEFKELFRTPVYLFQCVLPSFLFPIIFSVPIIQRVNQLGKSIDNIGEIKDFFNGTINNGFGFGLVICIINFLYMFNLVSVTSISREGETATFIKYIPIPLKKQYKYKSMPGFILNLISSTYAICFLNYLVPQISIILNLELLLISILTNILVNYLSVIIDVLNPKLNWSTEYAVVKQNINMIYGGVLNIFVILSIIGISSYIDNTNILTIILSALIIFILAVFEIFLSKFESKIFRKIS